MKKFSHKRSEPYQRLDSPPTFIYNAECGTPPPLSISHNTEEYFSEYKNAAPPPRSPSEYSDAWKVHSPETGIYESPSKIHSVSPMAGTSHYIRLSNALESPDTSSTAAPLTRQAGVMNILESNRIGLLGWFFQLYVGLKNSYFSHKLAKITIVLLTLEIVLLVISLPIECNRGSFKKISSVGSDLIPIHILLGIPSIFILYRHGGQSRRTRAYLQFCEGLIILETIVLLLWFMALISQVANPKSINESCKTTGDSHAIIWINVAISLLIDGLSFIQITQFCRLKVHYILQRGSRSHDGYDHIMNRAESPEYYHHDSDDHHHRMPASPPSPPHPRLSISVLRERLYSAAISGDVQALNEVMDQLDAMYNCGSTSTSTSAVVPPAPSPGIDTATPSSSSWWPEVMYSASKMYFRTFAKSSRNPLHGACLWNQTAILSELIKRNFPVNSLDRISLRISWYEWFAFIKYIFGAQDRDKSAIFGIFDVVLYTPLHLAVLNENDDMVSLLLRHGADPSISSQSSIFSRVMNVTPLFVATKPSICQLLVEAGANILALAGSQHSSGIFTVLQKAKLNENDALVKFYESRGGDMALTPLHTAVASNDLASVSALLRTGINPDVLGEVVEGRYCRSSLHWAAIHGNYEAMTVLLLNGASLNLQDASGRTPLHYACRLRHVMAVDVLLASGANPSVTDSKSLTPLLYASYHENIPTEIFSMLVSTGADINYVVPSTRDTALHIALRSGNRNTAFALIRNRADMSVLNRNGKRAVDCISSTALMFEINKEASVRSVMISYPHSHTAFAKSIRSILDSHNITTWMDFMNPSGIKGGSVWRDQVAQGIFNSSVLLCVINTAYINSKWCMKELSLAHQAGIPVIAVSNDFGNYEISRELDTLLGNQRPMNFNDYDDRRNITTNSKCSNRAKLLVKAVCAAIESKRKCADRNALSRENLADGIAGKVSTSSENSVIKTEELSTAQKVIAESAVSCDNVVLVIVTDRLRARDNVILHTLSKKLHVLSFKRHLVTKAFAPDSFTNVTSAVVFLPTSFSGLVSKINQRGSSSSAHDNVVSSSILYENELQAFNRRIKEMKKCGIRVILVHSQASFMSPGIRYSLCREDYVPFLGKAHFESQFSVLLDRMLPYKREELQLSEPITMLNLRRSRSCDPKANVNGQPSSQHQPTWVRQKSTTATANATSKEIDGASIKAFPGQPKLLKLQSASCASSRIVRQRGSFRMPPRF